MTGSTLSQGLPANYRLALAVSTAILAHTLLFSSVPAPIHDQDDALSHRLTFQLVSTGGAAPSRPSPSASAQAAPKPRHDSFVVPTAPQPVPTRSEQTTPSPAPETAAATPEPLGKPQPAPRPGQAIASRPTAPSAADGRPARPPVSEAGEPSERTQITRSPTEQDPYLIRLATHLARELEQLRLPAINQLRDTVRMEIELHLLANGALTRARVIRSTGSSQIDGAAYRAALAASPYPEPPQDGGEQRRFEVELVFTPKRL